MVRRNHRAVHSGPMSAYQQFLHNVLHASSCCQQDVWQTPQGPMVRDALGCMLEYNGGRQFYDDAQREANGGDQTAWAAERGLIDDNTEAAITAAVDASICNVYRAYHWNGYEGGFRHDRESDVPFLNYADSPLSLRWSPGQMAVLVTGFMMRLGLFDDQEVAFKEYLDISKRERRTMIWRQFASWKGWRLLAQSPIDDLPVAWTWDDRLGEPKDTPVNAGFVLQWHLQAFCELPFGEYMNDLLYGYDANLHLHCTGDGEQPTIMAYDGMFHITPFMVDVCRQVNGLFAQASALPHRLDELMAMQRMVPTLQGDPPVDSRFLTTAVTPPTPDSERMLERLRQREAPLNDRTSCGIGWNWCISAVHSLIRMAGWAPGPDGAGSLVIMRHITDANRVDAEAVCRYRSGIDASKVFTVDLIEQASDGPHVIPVVDAAHGVSIPGLMDGNDVLDAWHGRILQAHRTYVEEHHE